MPRKRPPRPAATAAARRLRRDATVPERILWSVLRGRRLGGLKFRRQHPVGPFVVDFYCHAAAMVVEVDGRSHEDRTEYLQQQGLRVFRVTNDDVQDDVEAVARGIAREVGVELE